MSSLIETGWLPPLCMAGIVLLFSVTDDISCSLFIQILCKIFQRVQKCFQKIAPSFCIKYPWIKKVTGLGSVLFRNVIFKYMFWVLKFILDIFVGWDIWTTKFDFLFFIYVWCISFIFKISSSNQLRLYKFWQHI